MKNMLFLTTAPQPALPGTDAVFQDVELLRGRFDGSVMDLYPFRKPCGMVPQQLMGLHKLRQLKRAAADASLIHVFSATLKPLPCLNGLSRPIVYTVTASAGRASGLRWFEKRPVCFVVNNERDRTRLQAAGMNVKCIMPGLDLSRFAFAPPRADAPFTLLAGSAPWTRGQFRTKGIDALIRLAADAPDIRLVFLWRRILHETLVRKVEQAGISSRVTILNERVDVNEAMSKCHATVVLAEHDRLVKSWPHSALESLAAGKPVLLSNPIAMSDYLEREQCGVAVDSFAELAGAVRRLRAKYSSLSGPRLSDLAARDFAPDRMLEEFARLYQDLAR